MKYFVVSDIHGFLKLFLDVLQEKGFDISNPEHKVIICGDIMDRGKEALSLQSYIMELLNLNKVILVRGNHEDLMLDMLNKWHEYLEPIRWGFCHHLSNGTFHTALQLTNLAKSNVAFRNPELFGKKLAATPFVKDIIPRCVNYFETQHYIFVHGYIPCGRKGDFSYNADWRTANQSEWNEARWLNGMDAAQSYGIKEPNKTIICGHWHCSYGHKNFENSGEEFGEYADFSPYYGSGIIAIDACTAYSGKINCLVLDD